MIWLWNIYSLKSGKSPNFPAWGWLKVCLNSLESARSQAQQPSFLVNPRCFSEMASSKVMQVIVKKETMRVQNAMAFLFMCVSKDYLEIFCTLQEDPNVSHYRQRRKYMLKSLQLLPLRKEASTNYLLQVLGKTHTHTHTHTIPFIIRK